MTLEQREELLEKHCHHLNAEDFGCIRFAIGRLGKDSDTITTTSVNRLFFYLHILDFKLVEIISSKKFRIRS